MVNVVNHDYIQIKITSGQLNKSIFNKAIRKTKPLCPSTDSRPRTESTECVSPGPTVLSRTQIISEVSGSLLQTSAHQTKPSPGGPGHLRGQPGDGGCGCGCGVGGGGGGGGGLVCQSRFTFNNHLLNLHPLDA